MTTTPNLPPLPESAPSRYDSWGQPMPIYLADQMRAHALAAYHAGRDAGLVAAAKALDDAGEKLQHAHDYGDGEYWEGVGATVDAGEIAILALKSDSKGGE